MALKNGLRESGTKVQTPPPVTKPARKPPPKTANGHAGFDLNNLLYVLQAMKVGDFSVRMAGDHLGIEVFLEPRNGGRGVEPAGICEDDAFHAVRRLRIPPAASRRPPRDGCPW